MRLAEIGDGDGHDDFVGAWRVGDAHFHAVEMAAHERRVFVAERRIERNAGSAAHFRRGNAGRAFAQNREDASEVDPFWRRFMLLINHANLRFWSGRVPLKDWPRAVFTFSHEINGLGN
jgi:hypothetical protein